MSFVNRIVIDTSTLVSSVLRPQSTPRKAFLHAIATAKVCVSNATLAELERVLLRDKFDRYLDQESRLLFIQYYRAITTVFDVTIDDEIGLTPSCRDPQDNKFLALISHCNPGWMTLRLSTHIFCIHMSFD